MNACQLSESLGTAKTSMPSAFEKAKGSLAMFHESFLVYFGTLFPTAAQSMECQVIGNRRRSPLPQGGLEVPCTYKMKGKMTVVDKARRIIGDLLS